MFRKLIHRLILITLTIASLAYTPTLIADPADCANRVNNTTETLLECVTLAGVSEHLEALQAIAQANGGTRVAGSPGSDASVAYVVEKMTVAGYDITLNAFPLFAAPLPILQQLTPISTTYQSASLGGTGYGDVHAAVTAVDVMLGLPRDAVTSGCEAADFAAFPAGNIALIQRGTCTFDDKVSNAEAAGASAVIIFNQGNTPEREGLAIGSLSFNAGIPVVGAAFADGAALSQTGSTAYVRTYPPQDSTQYNVIAESKEGDPNTVVMAGAHLDSVVAGPGMNDNGSGSAALLEVAEQMANVTPRNKVRFAWWAAEEAGLVGSTRYVNGLSQAERERIALYLNFDMIGSPNHGFFIFDGDNSDRVGVGAGPSGSAAIEKTFERYFTSVDIPFKGTDLNGRSDYRPFMDVGIPVGGLFTGGDGIKTAAEVSLWGGVAGQRYDPCYHLICDTFNNVNLPVLEINSDAIAYAMLHYAMDTSDLNTTVPRFVKYCPLILR